MRQQPDDRLDGDEGEREPHEEPVAAEPPLVRVHEQRTPTAAAAIPAPVPHEPPADVERGRAAGSPRGGSPASRRQDSPERRLRQPWSRVAAQPLQLLLAPLCAPFVEGDAPAQHEVDERRILARPRVDRAQLLEVSPRARACGPSSSISPCSRGTASAKKSRSSDSSRSSTVVSRAAEPRLELVAPGGGQAVHAARARAVRGRPRRSTSPSARAGVAPGRSGCSSRPRRSASSGRRWP